MNENPQSGQNPNNETAFMELAIEMAMVERTSTERDAFRSAESMLREAVEYKRTQEG